MALQGQDFDTGRDVADGNTHRITTTWDSASGVLTVYDNGQMVKSWQGVSTGMIVDIRAQGANIADATGRHTLQTGGVTAVVTGVDSSLVVPGSK